MAVRCHLLPFYNFRLFTTRRKRQVLGEATFMFRCQLVFRSYGPAAAPDLPFNQVPRDPHALDVWEAAPCVLRGHPWQRFQSY